MSTLGKRVDAVMCLVGSNPTLSVLLRPTTSVLGFEEQVHKVYGMYIVYILKSLEKANQYYVGLETYVSFKNRDRAIAFEKYLKFGSGNAFLRKRLV